MRVSKHGTTITKAVAGRKHHRVTIHAAWLITHDRRMFANIDAAVSDRTRASKQPCRAVSYARTLQNARAREKKRRDKSRSSDKEVTNCLARRERSRRGPFTSELRSRARNDLRTLNRENVEAKRVNFAGKEYCVADRCCVSSLAMRNDCPGRSEIFRVKVIDFSGVNEQCFLSKF